jgi:hypothetical protein
MHGIIAIATAIPDMGAISSVNLLKNRIGSDQAEALVSMLKEHPTLKSLCGNRGDETELDMSGKMNGAGDDIMLVAEVSDNGALSKLVMRQNNINGAEAGRAFADMLAQNTVLKMLDLSSQKVGRFGRALDAAFAKEFAVGISGNRTLPSLDISDNSIVSEAWINPPQQGLKVGDLFYGNPINRVNENNGRICVVFLNGIKALADAIPDMGALTSLHVGKNNIPEKEMKVIIAVAMRMGSMRILCGVPFKDKTIPELDVSEMNLGTEGARVVAEYLDGNGTITSVDITKNDIAFSHELLDQLAHKWAASRQLRILFTKGNTWHDKACFHQALFADDLLSSKLVQETLDLTDRGLQGILCVEEQ